MTATRYEPTHLQSWSHPHNYFGATWSGWYPFLTQNRDSRTLTRSNYRVALNRLRALSTDAVIDGEEVTTVTDTRERHFACGWVEMILIHESNEEALRLADEIAEKLEGYPCLDEFDWSSLESEEAATYWEGMSIRERVEICQRFRISPFAARRDEIPNDPCGELVSYLADGC